MCGTTGGAVVRHKRRNLFTEKYNSSVLREQQRVLSRRVEYDTIWAAG